MLQCGLAVRSDIAAMWVITSIMDSMRNGIQTYIERELINKKEAPLQNPAMAPKTKNNKNYFNLLNWQVK